MIESPPYFHPEQAAAAVDAGKHVYLAKPMAVDVPGCMTIAETGKKATARKLVCLIDFQTRANDLYLETLRRVHQGDIGRLVSAVASYPWVGTVHDDHTRPVRRNVFASQKNVPGALDEIRCLVYGTEGIADTDYTGAVTIRGKHPYEGGRMTNLYTSAPAQHREFLQRHHQRQG